MYLITVGTRIVTFWKTKSHIVDVLPIIHYYYLLLFGSLFVDGNPFPVICLVYSIIGLPEENISYLLCKIFD